MISAIMLRSTSIIELEELWAGRTILSRVLKLKEARQFGHVYHDCVEPDGAPHAFCDIGAISFFSSFFAFFSAFAFAFAAFFSFFCFGAGSVSRCFDESRG